MKKESIKKGYIGQDLILTLAERRRLDILVAQKVQKAILRSARKKHANILLDLQSVHFIDSAAIAMLIEVNERLSGTGNNFFLTGITKEAMELIQLAPVLKDMIKPTDCNQEPLPEK